MLMCRLGPFGVNPLHVAVWRNHEGLTEALLKVGADPDVPDEESGWTALHRAVYFGHLCLASKLLRGGASVSIVDFCGRTPLDILSQDLSTYIPGDGPGEVFAWGSDATYALGIGTTSEERAVEPLPARVEALHGRRITHLAAAKFHSCAIDEEGGLWTWGWGIGGRLGHPSSQFHAGSSAIIYPRQVSGLSRYRVAKVAAAKHHTLVCTTSGELFSFGSNKYSQLGYSGVDTQSGPRRVCFFRCRISAIAAANKHSAAVTSSGEVFTWGCNSLGQLGYGTFDSMCSGTPRLVEALKGRKSVSVAASKRHSLVMTEDGEVFTFGHRAVSPRRVLLVGCRNITVEGGRTMAFHRGHAAVTRPVAVSIAAGAAHSSALTSNGVVLTWRSADPALQVQEVGGALAGKHIVSISAGKYRTAAVTKEGDIFCWEGRSDFFPADGRISGSGSKRGPRSRILPASRERYVPVPKQGSSKKLSFGQGTPSSGSSPGYMLQRVIKTVHQGNIDMQQVRILGSSPSIEERSPIGSYSSVKSNDWSDSASFLERISRESHEASDIRKTNSAPRKDSSKDKTEVDVFEKIKPIKVQGIKRAGHVVVGEKHTLALQRWMASPLKGYPLLSQFGRKVRNFMSCSKTNQENFEYLGEDLENLGGCNPNATACEDVKYVGRTTGEEYIEADTEQQHEELAQGPPSLQHLCEEAVAYQLVEPRTALQVLEYADVAGAALLKAYCMNVAVCNLDTVLLESQGAFEELPHHLLMELENHFKSRYHCKDSTHCHVSTLDSSLRTSCCNANSIPAESLSLTCRPTAEPESGLGCNGAFQSYRVNNSMDILNRMNNEMNAIRLNSQSSFKDFASAMEEESVLKLKRSITKKLQQIEHLKSKQSRGENLDAQQIAKISQRPIFVSAMTALDDGMPPEDIQALIKATSSRVEDPSSSGFRPGTKSRSDLPIKTCQSAYKDSEDLNSVFQHQYSKKCGLPNGILKDGFQSSEVTPKRKTRQRRRPPKKSGRNEKNNLVSQISVQKDSDNTNVSSVAISGEERSEFDDHGSILHRESTEIDPVASVENSEPKSHIVGFAAPLYQDKSANNPEIHDKVNENICSSSNLSEFLALPNSKKKWERYSKPCRGGLSMFLRGELETSKLSSRDNKVGGHVKVPDIRDKLDLGCWGSAGVQESFPVNSFEDIQREQGISSGLSTPSSSKTISQILPLKESKSSRCRTNGVRVPLETFLSSASASKTHAWGTGGSSKVLSDGKPSLKDIQEEQEQNRQIMMGSSPPLAAKTPWSQRTSSLMSATQSPLSCFGSSPSSRHQTSSSLFGSSPGRNAFLASPIPTESKWFVPEVEQVEQRRAKPLKAIQVEESAMKALAGRYGSGNVRIMKK